ncbi:hypothetical protein KAK06_12945 [Ideonella sp. 4Y11]|uniref:Zinc-finger domain-containing protein n=1 Tax=Ideonella aquatica TaxID=2824119 RepID=A0A940YJJ9_9BURK|nr:hypothetical protein [Ideonella aquatica]MBQ0959852.1 hypothetical protein [Ideonella aquatica]
MHCRDAFFLLHSGPHHEAGWPRRLQAHTHRWWCVQCRRLARDDARLDRLLAQWRAQAWRADDAAPR